MSVLTDLVSPYSQETFLKEVWTKKSVHLTARGDRRFNSLFSWEKLTELLNYHEFEFPALRLAKDGQVLEAKENENFVQHCQEGATLIIDRVHKLVPEITRFVAALRREIGHPVQVNTYCSWPGTQGFKCHYDTHEVFILQVDGDKEWYVFPDTVKYPLIDQKSARLEPPEVPPVLRCTLQPGDVLYIPRGHWHYAVAGTQPSLHLTLGVLAKTGIDFLEWFIQQARDRENWCANLPLLTDAAPVSLAEQIKALKADAIAALSDEQLIEEYSRAIAHSEKPFAPYSFPHQAGFNIFPQGIETTFTRPPSQRIQIDPLPDESGYRILADNKEITLNGVPQKFVEHLFHYEQFTGSDVVNWLSDFDWESEIVPVLSHLVMEGIIFVNAEQF
ncbi:cupin-like domain-containing protein [Lusitaniella coriacea LEGE 07157]|uniref:Cupin-like domain-containing protein n=1 Tax=Lusitaniella coriacea LEGE 07157 TaxID=945747 RepID=A0A8J7B6Y2_9CYAN|nr:cupin domain-containing protein [Lusitaniella coriacea]MBE9114919.1 cupin-like domain-containing protein [Lusitaniella coriacea LEGE 07157]